MIVGSNLSFMILDFISDFVFKNLFRLIFEVFTKVVSMSHDDLTHFVPV